MSGEVFEEDIVGDDADYLWRRSEFDCCGGGLSPRVSMSGIRSVVHRRPRDSASANSSV